ncbi:fatty-acyl-CoA synthase [Solimonas aquatica]|uniref:Fatty-acyl-CoA synthase n=1 Tax=Solimonas aquatica TaxID=489703 RepID=A0A1H9LS34_9GAMM|nr:acyl-CoA synthetase [Solimonas aquatica]SER14246.1 fatty-acyl-CoA synthase [Solimonas aquatica]
MSSAFDQGLDRCAANYVALSPVDFIARSAAVYGERPAIVYGEIRRNWAQTYERARRLASALAAAGVRRGDTVAVLLPNTPAMVEAHFGVPMSGAVLNTLNTRLDEPSLRFMLSHGEARLLIVDTEFAPLVRHVITSLPQLKVIAVHDPASGAAEVPEWPQYEDFLAAGDPQYAWQPPEDEWQAIALNYTSGTTGDPKGVVYHHRGAALNAVSNVLEWDMGKHPVYLWTLPMFHCNGWCFPWTVALRAGVNVCLRKFDPLLVLKLIREERVSHYCGAPIVQAAIANAPLAAREGITHTVRTMVAGAPPPPAVIAQMTQMGFELSHVYGLTEVYGPAAVCAPQEHWRELDAQEQARLTARQGVRYHLQSGLTVLDPQTGLPVPADGETMGELAFRGNICMKGYLKNPRATETAFAGGWFHTGDLGVIATDGYVQIKDRAKDIIISGGENISSIEIEDTLYRHPAVAAAAVVAAPDPKWGETPCAFVELKPGMQASAEELLAHCRQWLAGFKLPKQIRFGELPKTSTGKIQKFELRKLAGSQQAIDLASSGRP